jgi:phenylacetate-CoA ligase
MMRRIWGSAYLAYHLLGHRRRAALSRERLEAVTARRVRRMVAFAYRHVPYYRETMRQLSLRPSDIRTADDLSELPVVERAELQRQPQRFVAERASTDRCLALRSGGSTGEPLGVWQTPRAVLQYAAAAERSRRPVRDAVGARFGYREALIFPTVCSVISGREFCHRCIWLPPGARIDRHRISLFERPEDMLAKLNEIQPDLLYTYGSCLDALLAYLRRSGDPFHRPRAIVYSCDAPSAATRRYITEQLGLPLFSWYQSVEAPVLGFECEEHRGLHLNSDLHVVRIVDADGRTLPIGDSGDVVVSNMVNRGTVVLNYRVGDRAALLPEPCPCGSALPLLSFPQGRCDDYLRLPSGATLHAQAICGALSRDEPIWQYQIVQDAPDRITLSIVADPTCDRQQVRESIERRLATVLGEAVTVTIQFVESLKRTAAGKRRIVSMPDSEPTVGAISPD